MKNGPYELVVAPPEFPGKKYRNRYCYEHTLVWWKATGQVPQKDEVVHHKNHQHRDNRFCNLELKHRKDHNSDHKHGKSYIELLCDHCGIKFLRERRNVMTKKKAGQKLFFCNLRCGALKQAELGGKIR